MKLTYDHLAGQSAERLAAISDGIFGVAMTLLLLELSAPEAAKIHGEWELFNALRGLLPSLAVYLMSFVTLGIFWVGQQTQLNHLDRSDRNLTWLHLAFLFVVTILPFSTRLLTRFLEYRVALLTYWFNIFLLGALLYAAWGYTNRAGLVRDMLTCAARAAIFRRIILAQAFYAVGAMLCFFSTYWSIGFIVLVQLNFAVSPQTWLRGGPPAAEDGVQDTGA